MKPALSSDFFVANRRRLRELFTGMAPIILTSNGLIQKSADETYLFSQESNFWYLTGINEPNVVLVMDKAKEYLIIPELSHARIMFDGAIDPELLIKKSGVKEVLLEKPGWKKLAGRLQKVSSAAVLAPSPRFVDQLGMYTNPARRRLIHQLKKHNENLELLDLRKHLQHMRMIKQPQEIEALKRAIDITVKSLKKVKRKYKQGSYKNEFEIELDLTRFFWENGGLGHGFDPIVAGGKKAAQLHSMDNNAPISIKKPLLLDVGARNGHYAADISRCWALQPTRRYEKVYEAVIEVLGFALERLKPGVVPREYEKEVEQFMGEKLRELGLIRTIERETVRHYFPSLTSHFLGIDVHDFGDYDQPLEAGAVLTVEPGIYIPKEGIGIRIEEDILITKDGHLNLSANLPISLS